MGQAVLWIALVSCCSLLGFRHLRVLLRSDNLQRDAEQRCWTAAAAARCGGAAAAVLVALSCWAPQVAHAGVTLLDLPACQKFTPAGDLRYWCGPAQPLGNLGAERAFTRVTSCGVSACCWMYDTVTWPVNHGSIETRLCAVHWRAS